jgi:hypothetical protein
VQEGGREGGREVGGREVGRSGERKRGRGRRWCRNKQVSRENASTKSVIIFACMCKRQWGLSMPKQRSPHLVLRLLQLLHLSKHHRLVCLGAPHYPRHKCAHSDTGACARARTDHIGDR